MLGRQPQRTTALADSTNSPIGNDESELWSMAHALAGR